MIVYNNKLIKGGNRPKESKKGSGGVSTTKNASLNTQRLTEPDYLPTRQIGAVEVATKSGELSGRVCSWQHAPADTAPPPRQQ